MEPNTNTTKTKRLVFFQNWLFFCWRAGSWQTTFGCPTWSLRVISSTKLKKNMWMNWFVFWELIFQVWIWIHWILCCFAANAWQVNARKCAFIKDVCKWYQGKLDGVSAVNPARILICTSNGQDEVSGHRVDISRSWVRVQLVWTNSWRRNYKRWTLSIFNLRVHRKIWPGCGRLVLHKAARIGWRQQSPTWDMRTAPFFFSTIFLKFLASSQAERMQVDVLCGQLSVAADDWLHRKWYRQKSNPHTRGNKVPTDFFFWTIAFWNQFQKLGLQKNHAWLHFRGVLQTTLKYKRCQNIMVHQFGRLSSKRDFFLNLGDTQDLYFFAWFKKMRLFATIW